MKLAKATVVAGWVRVMPMVITRGCCARQDDMMIGVVLIKAWLFSSSCHLLDLLHGSVVVRLCQVMETWCVHVEAVSSACVVLELVIVR